VLATLQPDQPRGGWWARFRQWLREALTPPPQRADQGWWRRLITDLGVSQAVLEGIAWGALALVLALVSAVLVNELRVAGLLKGWKRRSARGRLGPARPAALTLLELERTGPSQRPRLLLELVTARLGEQDRLPPARALTVHELTRAARLRRSPIASISRSWPRSASGCVSRTGKRRRTGWPRRWRTDASCWRRWRRRPRKARG